MKASGVVTLFVPTLSGGGAERVMIMVANGLASHGLDVHLVTADAEGSYRSSVSPQVKVVNLRASRLLFALPRLAAYFRRERPRSVLSAIGHANVASVIICRLVSRKTRLVISVHNSLEQSTRRTLIDLVLRRLMTFVAREADAIVTVSRGIERQVLETYQLRTDRVRTIYNPLDVDGIARRATELTGHPWLDDRKSPVIIPVIIGVGRLTEQKNFHLLLRAFALVRTEISARLVILGDGSDRPKLEQTVRALGLTEDVLLHGFVENPIA